DFDVVDRFRIDVVQPRRRTAAARANVVAESAAAVDTDAIDIYDRLIRLRQTRGSADADLSAFTGETARRENRDGGIAGGKLLRQIAHRCVAQRARVDRADRVAELALLGLGSRTRD